MIPASKSDATPSTSLSSIKATSSPPPASKNAWRIAPPPGVSIIGPRVLAEFLAEIAAERSITTIIDRKLAVYVDLDPAAVEAAGGDKFWPAPLREVRP